MKRKTFFLFLSLIFIVFSFGCVSNGGSQEEAEASYVVAKFPINGTILINGNPGSSASLVSGEPLEISLKFKNSGDQTMYDLTGISTGCLEEVSKSAAADLLEPNAQQFFSWSFKALDLQSSSKISCPQALRLCYETEADGVVQIVLVPENWNSEFPIPSSTYTSDVLSLGFQLGAVRVLKEGDNNFTGKLIIMNVGPGWVDYANYSKYGARADGSPALGINLLKNLTLKIATEDSGIVIKKVFDEPVNEKETVIDTTQIGKDKEYLLRLIQGRELDIPIKFEVKDPSKYQSTPVIETLQIEIHHGYCIDVGSVDITMTGR